MNNVPFLRKLKHIHKNALREYNQAENLNWSVYTKSVNNQLKELGFWLSRPWELQTLINKRDKWRYNGKGSGFYRVGRAVQRQGKVIDLKVAVESVDKLHLVPAVTFRFKVITTHFIELESSSEEEALHLSKTRYSSVFKKATRVIYKYDPERQFGKDRLIEHF